MFKLLKASFITAIILVLSSCATTRSVADGAHIPANSGVLVFKVDMQLPAAQLQYRKFSTNSSFGYFFAEEIVGPDGSFVNKTGETYWVTPVKAAECMWSKIMLDTRYATFHGSNRFTIEPGTITYVGHLTIKDVNGSAYIGVVDGEQDMRDYLAKHYPQYTHGMAFKKSITSFEF